MLSGNDALRGGRRRPAGTEEAFARQMTERGKALGLTNSTLPMPRLAGSAPSHVGA